jgi:single-stranded DNA-binding protein
MDLNKWTAVGKIKDKPQLSEQAGVKQVTFDLIVNSRAPDTNGQWVDNFMTVPCFARDRTAVAIAENCVAGHEVTVEANYVSWKLESGQLGHAMKVAYISFGYKPKAEVAQPVNVDGPPL